MVVISGTGRTNIFIFIVYLLVSLVLTGTNFENITRILSNSTQKELAIAQMLSLRKLARVSSPEWRMVQGSTEKQSLHPGVRTAGSIWWTGSVEEKLNLDYCDLIF